MNDPFRVGLLATSYEVERYVHINTCIVYSQVLMYFLLQNPVAQKNVGVFFRRYLKATVDFGGPILFSSSFVVVPGIPRG